MSVYDHLEFRHLKYIVAIADAGTFTGAAARLPVAQSALSRQIAEIEDILSIQIFERDRAGTTLTPAGESLLEFSRQMLQMREDVVKAVQAIQQAAIKPFQLGFTPFVEHHVLGTVCDAYRLLFPKGKIQPQSGDTDALLERLAKDELDAALVTLPLSSGPFCVQPIMHEPLVVCLRKDDSLARLDQLPPESLNGRLGIFSDPRHHPRAHARLLEMLREQGIEPSIHNPTFNTEHVQWMVRERLCLALIRQRETLQEEVTTRPILGVNWTLDSALVYPAQHNQMALPLLLRNLEKEFPGGDVTSAKKPSRIARQLQAQEELPFGKEQRASARI